MGPGMGGASRENGKVGWKEVDDSDTLFDSLIAAVDFSMLPGERVISSETGVSKMSRLEATTVALYLNRSCRSAFVMLFSAMSFKYNLSCYYLDKSM
jgi:hypothetical protein